MEQYSETSKLSAKLLKNCINKYVLVLYCLIIEVKIIYMITV